MNINYQSYFAGCLSGISQTIVGHPFDTLKVWSQNSQLKSEIKNLKGLYSGVSYPLLASGFLNSLSFGLAHTAQNHGYNYLESGLLAGAGVGLITAPIDYFKIQNQTHHLRFNQIVQSLSLSKMALGTTIMREGLGYGCYFPLYYNLKDQVGSFTAGGLAGIGSWTISYPIDTIKTRLQSGDYQSILASYQAKHLWKGYSVCVLRAGLVNAVGWLVYEKFFHQID